MSILRNRMKSGVVAAAAIAMVFGAIGTSPAFADEEPIAPDQPQAEMTQDQFVQMLHDDPNVILQDDLVVTQEDDIIVPDDVQTGPVDPYSTYYINNQSYYYAPVLNTSNVQKNSLQGCIGGAVATRTAAGCVNGGLGAGVSTVVVDSIYNPLYILTPTPKTMLQNAGMKTCRSTPARGNLTYYVPVSQPCY